VASEASLCLNDGPRQLWLTSLEYNTILCPLVTVSTKMGLLLCSQTPSQTADLTHIVETSTGSRCMPCPWFKSMLWDLRALLKVPTEREYFEDVNPAACHRSHLLPQVPTPATGSSSCHRSQLLPQVLAPATGPNSCHRS
jgi:hypothetical protein